MHEGLKHAEQGRVTASGDWMRTPLAWFVVLPSIPGTGSWLATNLSFVLRLEARFLGDP